MFGGAGLLALYKALSVGRMGLAAPISGVLSAALPVVAGSALQGAPERLQIVGFLLAIVGIWLVARSEDADFDMRTLGLPVLAGVGFGCFIVIISWSSGLSVFWPLVATRSRLARRPGDRRGHPRRASAPERRRRSPGRRLRVRRRRRKRLPCARGTYRTARHGRSPVVALSRRDRPDGMADPGREGHPMAVRRRCDRVVCDCHDFMAVICLRGTRAVRSAVILMFVPRRQVFS